ncbi:hypothetical protein Tco_1140682 [Tanacetum coccineum]
MDEDLMGIPVEPNSIRGYGLAPYHLKLSNVSFGILVKGTIKHGSLVAGKDNACPLTAYGIDADHAVVKIQEGVRRSSASVLGDRLVSWSSKEANDSTDIIDLQRLNTSPCLDAVLRSFGCDPS